MSEITDLNSALASIENELGKLRQATGHISDSQEAAKKATEAASTFKVSVQAIIEPTQRLVEKLEKLDFISRLDKLDASVSATHIGIQNLQGRIDNVERSLNGEISAIKESIRTLDRSIESRLDKLDASVSATHIGIQNLQGRIDNVERSLNGEISAIKESIRTLDRSIESRLNVLSDDMSAKHEALLSKMEQSNVSLRSLVKNGVIVSVLTLIGVAVVLTINFLH